MTRNLKALGLALLAVFAMSMVGASASQGAANEFTAGANPAILTAEQFNAGPEHEDHIFTAGIREFTCAIAKFDGTSATPTKTITGVTPTYENCVARGVNWPATVTHNGCTYTFNAIAGGPPAWTGSVSLVCPAGKVIEVHVYTNAANHAAGTSVCTITVEPFVNKGTNTYTNVAAAPPIKDRVQVTTTVPGIPITIHGSALLCGTSKEAKYTAASTLAGYKDVPPGVEGEEVGATVS